MSALDFLDEELALLEQQHRRRVPRIVDGPQCARPIVDGRPVVSFSSNDYLGLAAHPVLVAAAQEALARYGVGAGSSRLIVGNNRTHVALEEMGAAWLQCVAARLFNSGYAANLGVVQVLGGADATIFSDSRNHASLIDGCRLSRSKVAIFRNTDHLSDLLDESDGARRRVVVTESVSSMDGDVADLAALLSLARQHNAILLVDEAHAVGSFGAGGGGVLESLGIQADVVVAPLAKAIGTCGALVGGSQALVDLLWSRARTLVFTTGLPPVIAAATAASIQLVRGNEGAERRTRLWRRVQQLVLGLREAGFPCSGASPIVPIVLGDEREAMAWTAALLDQGIYVQGIRPPTVPPGTSRLRVTVTADHTEEDLARLLDGLRGLAVSRGTPT